MATVSVVSKVKSNTDDGYFTLGSYNYFSTWYPSNSYCSFDSGQVTNKSGCSAYNSMGLVSWYMPFWRFDQVDVPQGATITSAKLRLKRSTWTDSDGYPDLKSSFHIKMLATDNAHKQVTNLSKSTVSGAALRYADDISSPYASEPTYPGIPNGYAHTAPLAFGSNSVLWDVTAGSTTIDTWVDTPDITDVVKEVVDRAGWVADNAMCIYFCLPDIPIGTDLDTTGWVREFHSYGATGNPGAELHIEFDHKSSTPKIAHPPTRPVAVSPATSVTSSGGGGAPLVPGVDPPDRVTGLKTWHSVESLSSSLVDGDDIATLSVKSGQALDLTDNGSIPPTYEDDISAYPVANTDSTCGLENVTTDCRFLNPGADEAMVHLIHWRAVDASNYGLLSSVGAREYQGGNTGNASFRGHDWIQSGYGSEHMTLRLRGSDGNQIKLTTPIKMSDGGDYIFMCVRDLASQQVRLFMNGGTNYKTADCASSLSFKHATTDGAYNVGSYATDSSDSGANGCVGDSLIYVRDTDFTANELNTMGLYFAQRYGVRWDTIYQAGASPTLPYDTGLVARYKAVGDATHMTLNGTDVDVWKDISGNGYDLTPYASHGATGTPTFDEDGWSGTFAYNSKTFDTNVGGMRTSCVDFAGQECMQQGGGDAPLAIDAPYTIIAVGQPPTDYASRHCIVSMYYANTGMLDVNATNYRKWYMRNAYEAATNEYARPSAFLNGPTPFSYLGPGAFSVAAVFGDNNPSANSKLYRDGVVEQSAVDCGTNQAKRIQVGGANSSNVLSRRPWHGKIAEILIYDHEVSAANIKAIHDDYLSKEWGVRSPYTDYNDV